MRIHCLENVDKGLQFLREQHVHLENLVCVLHLKIIRF